MGMVLATQAPPLTAPSAVSPPAGPRPLSVAVTQGNEQLKSPPASDPTTLRTKVFDGEFELRPYRSEWRAQDDGSLQIVGTLLLDRGPAALYISAAEQQSLNDIQRRVLAAQEHNARLLRDFDAQWAHEWDKIHKKHVWVKKTNSRDKLSEQEFQERRAAVEAQGQREMAELASELEATRQRIEVRVAAVKMKADSVGFTARIPAELLKGVDGEKLKQSSAFTGKVVNLVLEHAPPDQDGIDHVGAVEFEVSRLAPQDSSTSAPADR
jgi:hypothetical protein